MKGETLPFMSADNRANATESTDDEPLMHPTT